MTPSALTHGHHAPRKPRYSLDGVALDRRYVYLRPDVWQALEVHMRRTGTDSPSMAITHLILSADTPTKADHETKPSP